MVHVVFSSAASMNEAIGKHHARTWGKRFAGRFPASLMRDVLIDEWDPEPPTMLRARPATEEECAPTLRCPTLLGAVPVPKRSR